MLELRLPSSEELKWAYTHHLKQSFPREELKPLHAIEGLWRRGKYHPWLVYDGEAIVGEALVWVADEGWCLFEYLCVAPERRNDGLGTEIIKLLLEAERGNVLFGESEIPQYAPDPAMAERRIGFYLRNGAKQAYYDTTLFGVPFHTLYWSDGDIDERELLEKHRAVYAGHFPKPLYKRFFNIPWEASMGMPKKIPWEE